MTINERLTHEQILKIMALSDGYKVPQRFDDFRPDFSCGKGWVSGWVGGDAYAGKTIYVGIDPDGSSHS